MIGVQQFDLQIEKVRQTLAITGFDALFALAGAQRLELWTRGFGVDVGLYYLSGNQQCVREL